MLMFYVGPGAPRSSGRRRQRFAESSELLVRLIPHSTLPCPAQRPARLARCHHPHLEREEQVATLSKQLTEADERIERAAFQKQWQERKLTPLVQGMACEAAAAASDLAKPCG